MIERALRFGEGQNLVGILTDPLPDAPSADRPAVIFLNSGILHRVGASRLYVRLARRLAEEGCITFRFDFSGIGDSDGRRDGKGFRESAVCETREAMDLLERMRGCTRFVLAGLCSGADMAFFAAEEDERVVGLVQLDPFAYPTPRFYLRKLLAKLLSPPAWLASLRARTARLASVIRKEGEDRAASGPAYRRGFPPRVEVAATSRTLVSRSVAFYLFFTGGMSDRINYATQYRDSFRDVDFGDRLRVDYVPDADHTVTDLEHQELVIEAVARWAEEQWPSLTPEEVA